MLKNYITIAINNLLKNKLYSAINIIGLAVGISACILLTLYVQEELSFDRGWEKPDLIYRMKNKVNFVPSLSTPFPLTSPLLLPALKNYFSEDIEYATRIKTKTGTFKIKNTYYSEAVTFVDKDFINIFQSSLISGNLEKTLQSPGNIALNEKTALLYFGDKNPIGRVINFIRDNGNEDQYKVTAVFRFISPNTSLDVNVFSLLEEPEKSNPGNWYVYGFGTYIRFNETANINKFIDRLPNFTNQNVLSSNEMQLDPDVKMSDIIGFSVQKMRDIHFDQSEGVLSYPSSQKGNETIIAAFGIISMLVLVIASINFVILTSARATQRTKEVAMRKAVGASFKQLFLQFIGESILITSLAFILAIALTELTLPFFELVINKNLSIPYFSPYSYLFSVSLMIFVGLLGGIYPALILSRLSPNNALISNKTVAADGSIRFKKLLVIFQFTVSVALIIATITAYCQLQFTLKHNPGFNPENLLVVERIGRPDIAQHIETLKQELLKHPDITNVALSSLQPKLDGEVKQSFFTLRRKTEESKPQQGIISPNMNVDNNFFETYEIPLLAGRFFIKGLDPEKKSTGKNVIINLEAAKQFGFHSAEDAVGKTLETESPGSPDYKVFTIIGVVTDSQFRNLRIKPEPEIYQLSPEETNYLTVKYRGDYQTMVSEVSHIWNKVVGDFLFRENNVKQYLSTIFFREDLENKAFMAFAILSVFIACIGLFGMAAFTVDRRVKEIGVRKVMGAKVKDIVKLLGWNFLKPVLFANLIAWPVAIFAMQSWLERFPYRFNSLYMIPICLVSGLIALAIAWFTVAGNTTRVAKSRPIKALRYE